LGIRITRGQIKLFADPMQSDIIIASPVGLATKLAEDAAAAAEAAAEEGGGKGGRKGGGGRGAAAAAGGVRSAGGAADFLSSIEICVVERADVMLMQNWQHVVTGQHLRGWSGVVVVVGGGMREGGGSIEKALLMQKGGLMLMQLWQHVEQPRDARNLDACHQVCGTGTACAKCLSNVPCLSACMSLWMYVTQCPRCWLTSSRCLYVCLPFLLRSA
jgi:hypothetical protein